MDRIDLTEQNRSLGDLVKDATGEISVLVGKEVELAKAELRDEIARTGRGAGAFGGAALTAYLSLLFASLALMFGLEAAGLPIGFAALAVGLLYGLAAAFLATAGKKQLEARKGVPLTKKTLKEDVEWARHPNG